VLALQGDFEAHATLLAELGAAVREVRVASELDGLDALVLPGGESTDDEPRDRARAPRGAAARAVRPPPVLGTCAGMIMLDRDHLGVLDMRCERNAFGRQVRSFEGEVELAGFDGRRFTRSSSARRGWPSTATEIEVLGAVDGHPVAVRAGQHPRGRLSPRALRRDPPASLAAGAAVILRRCGSRSPLTSVARSRSSCSKS
jgi:pyridoxal 5'-phosphate synthase pdxT subunit